MLIPVVRCTLLTYTGPIAITAISYASFFALNDMWVLALLALREPTDVGIVAAVVGLFTTQERSTVWTARVVGRLIFGLITRCAPSWVPTPIKLI